MTITVTEKDHWTSTIRRRFQRKINLIKDENRQHLKALWEKAKIQAVESEGITAEIAKLDELTESIKQLEKEQKEQCSLILRLLGMEEQRFCSPVSQIEGRIKSKTGRFEKALFREDPVGQEILRLEAEAENLSDTIWLATSPRQVKELWVQVEQVLKTESSPLQKKALKITSEEEN